MIKTINYVICVCLTFMVILGQAQDMDAQYPHMTAAEVFEKGTNGQTIVMEGCYTSGFEWSYIFPCDQPDNPSLRAWVTLSPGYNAGSKLKVTENGYRKLLVLGQLQTGKAYGHMGAYPHQIIVLRVYSAGPILKFKKK